MKITKNILYYIDDIVYSRLRGRITPPLDSIPLFGVVNNNILVDDKVKMTESDARNSQTASWWLENPEARVVELELVEKKS